MGKFIEYIGLVQNGEIFDAHGFLLKEDIKLIQIVKLSSFKGKEKEDTTTDVVMVVLKDNLRFIIPTSFLPIIIN